MTRPLALRYVRERLAVGAENTMEEVRTMDVPTDPVWTCHIFTLSLYI